jgi:hypothetical protein
LIAGKYIGARSDLIVHSFYFSGPKRRPGPDDPVDNKFDEPAHSPPRDDASAGTWESGSEFSGSNVSAPSVWSDNSGTTGDRSSRRALILQMAKARMRNNKDSPPKTQASEAIEEEASSIGGNTEGNTDIDFSGDLD